MCDNCSIESATLKLCSGCRKVKYCSQECQKMHRTNHRTICNIIKPLLSIPGYNDSIPSFTNPKQPTNRLPYTFLKEHAQQYIDSSHPGAICFSKFPVEKRDMLEHQMNLSENNNYAALITDIIDKCIYHFFCMDITSMTDMIDQTFVTVCRHPKVYKHFLPAIEFIIGIGDDGKSFEPTALRYMLIKN